MTTEQSNSTVPPSSPDLDVVEFGADAMPDVHADLDDAAHAMPLEEAPRSWRVAKALETLRAQINAAVPGRSKASDGTIGDPAHQSRSSDHNAWVTDAGIGVVTALDITHDPVHGCDAGKLADALRRSADRRIKYIISNRRIASSAAKGSAPAWAWRTYTGTNPHNKHCHISVQADKARFDSTAKWALEPALPGNLEAFAGETPESDDETLAEIERALAALAYAAGNGGDRPLLMRLTATAESVDVLLSRYAEAVRSRADGETLEAPAPQFDSIKAEYEALFASCRIPAGLAGTVAWHRQMLLRGKSRYQEATAQTGVPWWFIGIVHAMETSFNFKGHLHNGDPLTQRTVQVPKNRPPQWNPPSDWLASAVDALEYQNLAGLDDWSIARALYRWEAYNGWGYRSRSVKTPYLWSFSNHHTKGKFVRDGVYDPNALSKQCGAAVMLKALQNAGDVMF